MELLKKFAQIGILGAALAIVIYGLTFSGVRLWANFVVSSPGGIIRAAHIADFDRTLLFAAGNVYMQRRKDCPQAIVFYKKLLRFYPNDWSAKNNLAICYAVMGQSDAAKTGWQEILDQWPYHDESKKNLAEINKKRRR